MVLSDLQMKLWILFMIIIRNDYYNAYNDGLSLNPVLHSFQNIVKKYEISDNLIQAFLASMKTDLVKYGNYKKSEADKYIYGSAEAVGLMCLTVFVNRDKNLYEELRYPATKLGSAFQKVNFLRDLKNDIHLLNRSYFSEIENGIFNQEARDKIIRDIEFDFSESLPGIKRLPTDAKFPVFTAYCYYLYLLKKIHNTPPEKLISTRIRVSNFKKIFLLIKAFMAVRMRFI
jgi:phytoene synthase